MTKQKLFLLVPIAGLILSVNSMMLLGDVCKFPWISDCPAEKQYCFLRATEFEKLTIKQIEALDEEDGPEKRCNGKGAKNYLGFFTQIPDPTNSFDSVVGKQARCWAECKCVWKHDIKKCVCDENGVGFPYGRAQFVMFPCDEEIEPDDDTPELPDPKKL